MITTILLVSLPLSFSSTAAGGIIASHVSCLIFSYVINHNMISLRDLVTIDYVGQISMMCVRVCVCGCGVFNVLFTSLHRFTYMYMYIVLILLFYMFFY